MPKTTKKKKKIPRKWNLTKEVKNLYAKNYKKKKKNTQEVELNQGGEKLVCQKLQKKNNKKNPEPKAKIHKKKSHVHGLEDLILLRWQSY